MNLALQNATHQRLLEWWCLLNAKRQPSDLPKDLINDETFIEIQRLTSKAERLALWNGAFQAGNNWRNFE